MAVFKWTNYNTADTAVSGTALNALAIAGYAYGAEIDNSTGLFLYADLTLALSAAVTSVAPAFLSVFLLPNIDTHYTTTTGNPGLSYLSGTWNGAGGSVQYLQVRGLVLPPSKMTVVVQNNLGVVFPSTSTSVCNLYRYNEQSV